MTGPTQFFHMHRFHIPVMGTGFTLDSALRVAKLGISTVISLADDHLIEKVRLHYAAALGLPAERIRAADPDARARRITAWLDLVDAVTARQVDELKALPFEPGNDKWRYFSLLPDCELRAKFLSLPRLAGAERAEVERQLTAAVRRGDIDVNVMTKVDGATFDRDGAPRGPEHSLAKAAVRGFARSTLPGSLVLSAGVNPSLFGYMEELEAFRAPAKKPLIIKVSDFRSALIQAKTLAKRGLDVREFRIESGLNCGGHVFPTDGEVMGPILAEFAAQRGKLAEVCGHPVRITAQGGVGTHGEMRRLLEAYGVDSVGWGSPFLLVPEVVLLDDETRQKLERAGEDELYTSDASPLGVRFTNLRGSSSEAWSRARVAAGTPGSPCPNRLLAMNTEFAGRPLCTASDEYQKAKLQQLGFAGAPPWKDAEKVYEKACICDHLGGALVNALGIARRQPVAVCPGPNLAYFGRSYSLEEMVDHIYGRGESLVPADRPHMFAKELELYLDAYDALPRGSPKTERAAEQFRENLLAGLDTLQALLRGPAFPGENLASLAGAVERAAARLGRDTPQRAAC